MAIFSEDSCRICLSPNSAFVNAFGTFQERSIEKIVFEVCEIKLSQDKRLPQLICELCVSRLLHAESIKLLCRKNEKFLINLAEIGRSLSDQKNQVIEDNSGEIVIEVLQEDSEAITETMEKDKLAKSDTDLIDWVPFLELNEKSRMEASKKTSNFFCTYCFKEFNTRSKCCYHEKTHHETKETLKDLKSYTCDRCGVKFKNKSHVINHLKNVHLRIKRYQCNICGFAMYSKTHHTNHLKTHSNVREFKCLQCSKDFSRKEVLLVHLRTHTNIRPYICKLCDRSYTAHTDLKRHLFKHTGLHPYICQLCNKGYFLKRLLYEHVKIDHSGIDTTSWLTGKTVHNFYKIE